MTRKPATRMVDVGTHLTPTSDRAKLRAPTACERSWGALCFWCLYPAIAVRAWERLYLPPHLTYEPAVYLLGVREMDAWHLSGLLEWPISFVVAFLPPFVVGQPRVRPVPTTPSSVPPRVWVLAGALSTLVAARVSQLVFGVPTEHLGTPELIDQVSPWVRGVDTLACSLLPVLCEEAYFRGRLLKLLRATYSNGESLAVSSIAFMTYHTLDHMPSALAGGLVYGWITIRSGSIWTAVAMHAAWNMTTFAYAWGNGAT